MVSLAAQLDRRFTKQIKIPEQNCFNATPQMKQQGNLDEKHTKEQSSIHTINDPEQNAVNHVKIKKSNNKLIIPKSIILNKFLPNSVQNFSQTKSSILQKTVIKKIYIKKDKNSPDNTKITFC